jgi:hypothetical protein
MEGINKCWEGSATLVSIMRARIFSLLLVLTSLATAQNKTINDTRCELSIPSDWIVIRSDEFAVEVGAAAHSGDRALAALVIGFDSDVSSYVMAMKHMKATVVDENESRVLLQMSPSKTGKKGYIQITKMSPLECRASITYSSDSEADAARKIAESVQPVKK